MDVSCFVFEEIENKRLWVTLLSKNDNAEAQSSVIIFVDDSDFCSGGVECELKMQETVDYHANVCEATGGKV